MQNQINQLRDYLGRFVTYFTEAEYLSGSTEKAEEQEADDS